MPIHDFFALFGVELLPQSGVQWIACALEQEERGVDLVVDTLISSLCGHG